MNPLIEQMQNRRTIRMFDASKPVSDAVLNQVLLAVRQAPVTIGAQIGSIIAVRDADSRKFIMEHAKGASGFQQHIVDAPVFLIFLIDYYKVNEGMKTTGASLGVQGSVAGLFHGITDVGIQIGAATIAAESCGLATVSIGAIMNNELTPFIKYFNLPELVFPVCGMCLGYPSVEGAHTKVKPRLPYNTFVHQEKYHQDVFNNFSEILQKTNEELSAWKGEPMKWSDYPNIAWQGKRNPHLNKNLNDQGFSL